MKARNAALLAAGAAALGAFALARGREWPGFEGRVVLITGGSRGLGLELAREFRRRGARVVVCARDGAELARAREALAEEGLELHVRTCDVANEAQVAGLIREVEHVFGRLDVLVNNAGVIQVGPLETMTRSDFDEAMQVHYWGALNAVLAVLPGMKRRRDGRIVNIASIGGKIAVPHLLPYDASKFALVGLSEGLRAELAKDGILVTTVCPGLMRTGSPGHGRFKGRHRAEFAWFTVGDSVPVLASHSTRAARRIVRACRRGQPHLVLTPLAKAASLFHGVFPGLTARLLSFANRLLPSPGGIGSEARAGWESEGMVTLSFLTRLTREAESRNNQRE